MRQPLEPAYVDADVFRAVKDAPLVGRVEIRLGGEPVEAAGEVRYKVSAVVIRTVLTEREKHRFSNREDKGWLRARRSHVLASSPFSWFLNCSTMSYPYIALNISLPRGVIWVGSHGFSKSTSTSTSWASGTALCMA